MSEARQRLASELLLALSEVRDDIERLQEDIALAREEEQRLVQMQQLLLNPDASMQGGTKSNGFSGTGGHVSEWRMQDVLAALADEPLTAKELCERTGFPLSSVSVALIALRKQGLVRKAGVRRAKAGISPALWEPTPKESPS